MYNIARRKALLYTERVSIYIYYNGYGIYVRLHYNEQ